MEDIKDLMDRLKKRIISGGTADKPELKRRLDVIYEIYAGAVQYLFFPHNTPPLFSARFRTANIFSKCSSRFYFCQS